MVTDHDRIVAGLTRDNADLTVALEALEEEIVGERAKALVATQEAQRAAQEADAWESEYKFIKAERDRLKADLAAMTARNEALVEQNQELETKVQSLHLDLNQSEVRDALSDWLIMNGYSSQPLRVECDVLQRLLDAVF